jgi:Xaa-Pro aminopeptidase
MERSPDPEATARELFQRRREAVYASLGDGVLVLPAAPVHYRSRDTEYRYRPDSELFYLTGVTEAGAVAVLTGGDEPRFELFVRPRDPEAELWAGPRIGPDRAAELYGADACSSVEELAARLPSMLAGGDRLYYRKRHADGVEDFVSGALSRARARGARTGGGPRALVDPGEILDELRLIKDDGEIEALRNAAAVSIQGQLAAARSIGVGASERDVEAAAEGAFRLGGATAPAFATIVGAGKNACVLHYVDNEDTIAEGDLVLVDGGAEVALYNGDITRTYPASGRFSKDQRAVYEVVNAARSAAITAARPGATLASVHGAAVSTIVTGLVELGVLSGEIDELIEGAAHKPFFPHQTSHWLGLDVHDPGDYAKSGDPRVLEPGMVFTVEPGLYFRPELTEGGAARFAGIGVRIEDDVVITDDGCEVLTAGLATSADDIEAMMADSK